AMRVLADEPKANGVLARGFAAYERYPSLADRYKLRGLATARYPMYRGLARLIGMDLSPVAETDEGSVALLEKAFPNYDFHFIHFKAVDSRGEDGDFLAKVKAIEAVDALIPRIDALPRALALVAPGAGADRAEMAARGRRHGLRRAGVSEGRAGYLPGEAPDDARARARGPARTLRRLSAAQRGPVARESCTMADV